MPLLVGSPVVLFLLLKLESLPLSFGLDSFLDLSLGKVAVFFQVVPQQQELVLDLAHLFVLLDFLVALFSSGRRNRIEFARTTRRIALHLAAASTRFHMATVGLDVARRGRSTDGG